MHHGLKWASTSLTLLAALGCTPKPSPAADQPGPATPQAAPAASKGSKKSYAEVPGIAMIDERGIQALVLNGERSRVELSTVSVEGQQFEQALRAKIKEPSANPWDVQLQVPTTQPVEQGDVLLATFYFRTDWVADESGEGQTEFVFELARDPWTKSVSYPVRASRSWKKVHVPFVASESYKAGEAQAILRLGYAPETIEIADLRIENFKKQLALADLPTTKITYQGMQPDAPWRKAAAERIDQHRKAELTVKVLDAKGKPLPAAEVALEQKHHSFLFGTCVAANRLSGAGNEKYKAVIKEHFNVATIENSFKWVALDGDWGPGFSLESAQGAVKWLKDAGIHARGHVLIWPGWRNLPKSLKAYEKQPEELRRRVRAHIKELASKTKGTVIHWDVMNEPFDNHDLMDILGEKEMVEWFKIARAADPDAKLYINDYAILSGGGTTSPHRDHYEKTIAFLLENGAPLDGIGLQGHFGSSLTSPEELMVLLDRFAKFDKPLLVTEYDIVIDDEQLAARYTEDFYTVLFSHPAVEGAIMWGFWDSAHWKKNAAMFREDWSLKPSGKAYIELVNQRWRTRADGKTDQAGQYSTRGFLGQYEVMAQAKGKSKKVVAKLAAGGSTVTVTLE